MTDALKDSFPALFTAHPDGIYRSIALEQVRGWFTTPVVHEDSSAAPSSVVASEHLTPSVPNGGDSGALASVAAELIEQWGAVANLSDAATAATLHGCINDLLFVVRKLANTHKG